jgi:hypothetical protein
MVIAVDVIQRDRNGLSFPFGQIASLAFMLFDALSDKPQLQHVA